MDVERRYDKLDQLTETAIELAQEVNKLNKAQKGEKAREIEIGSLKKKTRRNQRLLWVVIASFAADVVLTLVLGVTLWDVQKTNDRIDRVTREVVDIQTTQRREVLCPLYKIFVDSRSEEGRKTYPKGPKEYDRIFDIIEHSYDVLNCVDIPKPPSVPKGLGG